MTNHRRYSLMDANADAGDPLADYRNPGPNVSLPHEPWFDAKAVAWIFIATAFGAGLVLAWMFTTGGLTQ
jgi:hypothetical protein